MTFNHVKKVAMVFMLVVLVFQSFVSPLSAVAETIDTNEEKESQLDLKEPKLEENEEETAKVATAIEVVNEKEEAQTYTLTPNLPVEIAEDAQEEAGIATQIVNQEVEITVDAETTADFELKLDVKKEDPKEQIFTISYETQKKELTLPSVETKETAEETDDEAEEAEDTSDSQEAKSDEEIEESEETEESKEAEKVEETEETTNESEADSAKESEEQETEESSETAETNESETDESQDSEEDVDKEEDVEEENEVGPQEDLGNIFEFEWFQLDGEDVADGDEIVFGQDYQVQYKWETDTEVREGDTASLQLPDVFTEWENTPDQDITLGDGTVVGTFTINNGVLEFTFNENIEGEGVQDGYVGFSLQFDRESFREEIEQEIDFDDYAQKDLTVKAPTEEIETSMDKKGETDAPENATEIKWSVDITNGGDDPITNGTLKDQIPEGLGEARDFVVREVSYDIDGNEMIGDEVDFNAPTTTDDGFEMSFDSIDGRSGYRVEYVTDIEDYTIGQFTNDATFNHDDGDLEAQSTVDGGPRSNPIQKDGEVVYNDSGNPNKISWTLVVNENGMSIDDAIVHDELPEYLNLDADSMTIENNGQDVTDDFNTDSFPITLGEVSQDETYTITFDTAIDWEVYNDGQFQRENPFDNTAELTDGENSIGEDDDTVTIWREQLVQKSGDANDYDYENKNLSWEVSVNKAGQRIEDAVLIDTIPAGVNISADDIQIEGADVDSDDIEITSNQDGTQSVRIPLGTIDSEVTLNYTTAVQDFEENSFTNNAYLEGDGIGEETPEDNHEVNPPANEFNKNFAGIDYNEKTIDWKLSVNPRREAIDTLTITDTFPNAGLSAIEDSFEVTLGGEPFDDYSLELTDDGHSGFVLTINDGVEINDELEISYTTSYDSEIVENPHNNDDESNVYRNQAGYNGTTVNGNSFDVTREADTRVEDSAWNSGFKEGHLIDEEDWSNASDRGIAWQVYMNYNQHDLGSDVSVTDTLDYEGEIIEDSIQVSVYDVDVEGNTTKTDEVLTPGEDYTVNIEDNELTVNFTNDVTERYVIEFDTTVPDISEENYVNKAVVNTADGEYPYSSSVDYDKWDELLDKKVLPDVSETYIGEDLDWEISVNESLSTIKDATLTDTISAGLSFIEDSFTITTASGDELSEGTDYTLEAVAGEDGQTVLNISFANDITEALTINYSTTVVAEDGQQVNNEAALEGKGIEKQEKETEKITAKQFSWVGGEFREDRGAIEIHKVDSTTGEVIDASEASFELYRVVNGENVLMGEYSTENGILEIGNLQLGNYVLVETEAPDGYRLSDKEIEIEVDEEYGDDEIVFGEEVENISDAKTNVPVEKVWDDADNQDGVRPEEIEVELLANGEKTDVDHLTLNAGNNWQNEFTDLPELDEAGEEIDYTIEEVNVESGYESEITGDSDDGFVVENSRETEVTEVSGEKTWEDAEDQDGVRPDEITVNLLANGTQVDEQVVTAEDDWSYEFTDLPKYEAGEEIDYTVTENEVEDYSTTIEGTDITNSYTPEERSVTVTKAWEDTNNQDGKRPEGIQVQLYANGDEAGDPVTLNEENDWTYTWDELAVNDAGEEIDYTLEELNVSEDYDVTIDDENLGNVTLTNSYEPELTDVSGEKTWEDADNQDGIRPDNITVNLLADGEVIDSQEVTADDDWSYEFTDLPVYQEGAVGEEINYTVTEDAVDDYSTAIDGYDITNSYTPDETSTTVTKSWNDANDQDGKRPETIDVQLYANGDEQGDPVTLSQGNDWTYTWDGLAVNEAGEAIDYTVEEVEVPEDYNVEVNDEDLGNVTISNSYTPEVTEVSGEKTWDDADDQDGVRPDEITVNLLANGEQVDKQVVTADDGWSYEFIDLPKFEAGEEITYAVTEDAVEDYTTTIEGHDITNSYAPGETSVTVNKAWDDAKDQDGKRPVSINVVLKADGEETGQSLTLNEDNHWQGTFDGLDEYQEGQLIDYTVEETNAPADYDVDISKGKDDNVVITNQYEPELTEVSGKKTWEDNHDQADKRPDDINVYLMNGTNIVEETKVSAADDWEYTFTDLPKYEDGTEIDYHIQEGKVDDYSTTIDGFNIINEYLPEKTSVNVIKNWNDADDSQARPDNITIKLYADGKETGETLTLDAENHWQGDFTDLDETTKDGEKINYTVKEEAVKGYKTSIQESACGVVITNTYKAKETPENGGSSDGSSENDGGQSSDKQGTEDKETTQSEDKQTLDGQGVAKEGSSQDSGQQVSEGQNRGESSSDEEDSEGILPKTGESSGLLYTIIGLVMVAAVAIGYVIQRKKKTE
ncbi:MAG: Cna B-type domain-containing protein [Tetragenococcus halophilus]|uniref:Cna B-type domain-containing protein n=1 Tax=Tetragenococcus halophilus TaxID=51669 RepID=UPI00256AF672|nr:Cna B-type domain-containing protein [Tetragenococcus halophilus]MDN6497488.1 Cna B-type domain-containing protein [Tetragenococcus koreensis]MDN6142934.1 Cna B-type domain-containing protein [Tetragenococcus halophilus]MDN6153137.1 Cna B-type domain-containing protein [Tetragenococcus halophilus]MDN6725704.1 Cna B-type domain-containing protein [Tetragenococcus halophilus]MDN6727421.1 Cna B-type domain-containing protein [Tetragenococcus halophilus]